MGVNRARAAWRSVLILAVFLGVGYATMHWVTARAVARGAPEYSVRLAAAMSGLFVGGAVASVLTLALLLGGRSTPATLDDENRDPRSGV